MRRTRTHVGMIASCLIIAAAALAAGPQCDEPFTEVLNKSFSGVTSQQFSIIESDGAWCAFWDDVHSIIFPPPPCDLLGIDFESEVAIVAALGSRPNGCYGVDIVCVDRLGSSTNLKAVVNEVVPGPGCACTQAVVNPVDVVTVSRPVGRVNFVVKADTLNCL